MYRLPEVAVVKQGSEVQVVRIRPADWTRMTGMSKRETYRRIYAGELRAVQVGKMWFIDAHELTDFFERMNEAA